MYWNLNDVNDTISTKPRSNDEPGKVIRGEIRVHRNGSKYVFKLCVTLLWKRAWFLYLLRMSLSLYSIFWGTNILNQVVGWHGFWLIPLFSVWLVKYHWGKNGLNWIERDEMADNTTIFWRTQNIHCIPPCVSTNGLNQVGCDRPATQYHFIWVNGNNSCLPRNSISILNPNVYIFIQLLLCPK